MSGVESQPHQPELNAYKSRFSWSDIPWEDKGEAIIDGSATGVEAAWPTIIHSSVFDNPIDDWYCYWSTHNENYLGLSTAPNPWGPWTFHSEVFSDPEGGQTASPSAVVVPEDSRLNLYYHVDPNFGSGGSQFTKLATTPLSGDGTSFTIQKPVLECPKDGRWDDRERSYLKCVRKGRKFVAVYQGRDTSLNIKGIGVAESFNGEQFHKTQKNPAYDNTQWDNPSPSFTTQGVSPSLSHLGGQLTIHYGDNIENVARALPYQDHDKALFESGEVVYEPPAWFGSGDYPNVQDFVADKEYVYMIYYREPNNADREIGVARVPQGEIL
jgi:hypothetical protein